MGLCIVRRIAAGIVVVAVATGLAAQQPPVLVLPPRAANAATGSQLLPTLVGQTVSAREALCWHEFAAGNVPTFLRTLTPVTTSAWIQGQLRTATFWCTRDYVGIGDDTNWFRMPMTPMLAQQLADRLECALPTRRMVDAIWAAAPVKLAPFPYSPAVYDITSVSLFHQHHLQIEQQRAGQSQSLLVAGTKKDVVASALIAQWPGRVVIYGWHQISGAPIQPLSKVHTSSYVDYSHGVRLVAREVVVDGVRTTIDAVLADPVLHPLLGDEGPFSSWRYPAGTAESFPLHDAFATGLPQLTSWRSTFVAPTAVAASPPPPSGDAMVVRVMDPAGGTEVLRLSSGLVRDVGVQADLLCEHRPSLSANGFERIGVFVRDRADGAFDGTSSRVGECYALTWDGGDGRLRCLRATGGVLTDLLPQPRFVTGTAWRRFRLEAVGNVLTFWLDGERLLQVVDTTHAAGAFGIGFHEYFATNANMRGTRADSFHADVPGAFTLRLQPGPQSGRLRVRRERGIPGDSYFTAFTIVPGAFPNGWFFGLDPALGDVLGFLQSGHPLFVGALDAAGAHTFDVWGLPIGLPLQAVAVELDPTWRWLSPSPPVATVTH